MPAVRTKSSHVDEDVQQSPAQVRKKLRAMLDSDKRDKDDLVEDCGSKDSSSFNAFMKLKGASGRDNETYQGALKFLARQGAAEPEAESGDKTSAGKDNEGPAKAVETTAGESPEDDPLDIGDSPLPGEDKGQVKLFDTCDQVHSQITDFLDSKSAPTKADFVRALNKLANKDHGIKATNTKQLYEFLHKGGPTAGAEMQVFYLAYVFFERRRLKLGHDKTELRLKMEKFHRGGLERIDAMNTPMTMRHDETAYEDEYRRMYIRNADGREEMLT